MVKREARVVVIAESQPRADELIAEITDFERLGELEPGEEVIAWEMEADPVQHPQPTDKSRGEKWDGEHCQDCGKLYEYVWTAPDPMWHEVMGKPGGLLCIECFDSRYPESLRWVPQLLSDPVPTLPLEEEK